MIRRHMPRQPNELWQPIFLALMCGKREVRGNGYARVQLNKADFIQVRLESERSKIWTNVNNIEFPRAKGEWDKITAVVFYQAGRLIGPRIEQPLPHQRLGAGDTARFHRGTLTLNPEAFLNHEHTRP